MMSCLGRMGLVSITGNEVLAYSAAKGRNDPRPLSPNLVDEPCKEDDRSGRLDGAVYAGPEGIISQTDRGEDGW